MVMLKGSGAAVKPGKGIVEGFVSPGGKLMENFSKNVVMYRKIVFLAKTSPTHCLWPVKILKC